MEQDAGRLTPLDVRFIDDHGHRPVFELLAPLRYYSKHIRNMIEVPAGFRTDFASVPRVAFAYMIAGGRATWEAVIHDYLYSRPDFCTRDEADEIFYEAMESDGEPKWRRTVLYVAVRLNSILRNP